MEAAGAVCLLNTGKSIYSSKIDKRVINFDDEYNYTCHWSSSAYNYGNTDDYRYAMHFGWHPDFAPGYENYISWDIEWEEGGKTVLVQNPVFKHRQFPLPSFVVVVVTALTSTHNTLCIARVNREQGLVSSRRAK